MLFVDTLFHFHYYLLCDFADLFDLAWIHIVILFTFWTVVTHDLGKVTTGLRAVLGRRAWALENALAVLSIFTFSLVKTLG